MASGDAVPPVVYTIPCVRFVCYVRVDGFYLADLIRLC